MKNMTYISDLLGGGSKTTNIPVLYVVLMRDNADKDEYYWQKKYGV